MKRGLEKLSPKELSLLNVVINGKVARSFYSKEGEVIKSVIPSYRQLKSFFEKNEEVYAIDGALIKKPPLGGRELYLTIERHGIS